MADVFRFQYVWTTPKTVSSKPTLQELLAEPQPWLMDQIPTPQTSMKTKSAIEIQVLEKYTSQGVNNCVHDGYI